MSEAAWRTKSGKPIRAAVVRGIATQIEKYEKALRLVETTSLMVDSERPPPIEEEVATGGKDRKE